MCERIFCSRSLSVLGGVIIDFVLHAKELRVFHCFAFNKVCPLLS